MKRYVLLLLSVLIAPAAFANTFKVTLRSTMPFSGSNWDDDTHEGVYSSWIDQKFVNMSGSAHGQISGTSFWLAPWDTITSATMFLSFTGDGHVGGVGELGGSGPLPIPNPGEPSIAPTFYSPRVIGIPLAVSFGTTFESDPSIQGYDLSPWLDFTGNHLYTEPSVAVDVTGWFAMSAGVKTPGSNWAGYIGGEGTAEIPYSLTIEGTYTTPPVPEPSSLLLLGTGVAGLATCLRRRTKNNN